MKLYKIVFFNSMILGTMVAISSYSWLTMWMGLEINLLSIIPLFSSTKNIFSSESSLKYFITQAMASLILLMTVIIMLLTEEFINPPVNSYLMMVLNSSLLTKMGAAPFHFWFPEVMEGLTWMNSFILLTWQKIAPMVLMMNNKINVKFLIFIIAISLMISTIMGLNQMSLRKIMAFSSINHLAWMLSTTIISPTLWMIYFSIYTIININIILTFFLTNTFYINQINNILNQDKMVKFTFMANFLSLGGLPPFIGFLPKWLVINWLTSNNLMLVAFMLIVFTLIMLFIYIRMIMTTLVLTSTEIKMTKIKISKTLMVTMNMISIPSLVLCTLIPSIY